MKANSIADRTPGKISGNVTLRKVVAGNELHYQKLSVAFGEVVADPRQRGMVQAREQLGKVGEDMAEWFQLPSRAEFDELARSVTELRRDLRRAKRQHEG